MNGTKRSILLAIACLVALADLISAGSACAADPRLNLITPRGMQRGTEQVLRFSGARLAEAQEVFLYDTNGIEVTNIKQVDGNNIDVTIRTTPDCRIGEHVAQVRTTSGISDYRSFFVGALPTVKEVEPNNGIEAPQAIEQNVTVEGFVNNEDIDYYEVTAKKGQRLSVEVEAIRLGFMFDSFISLIDANKFELASCDDTALGSQDGVISVIIPEDGKYYVAIREASFGGNGNCRYRLHIGNFPRPTVAYPAGGTLGQTCKVSFLGDPTGPIDREITVASGNEFRPNLMVSDEQGVTPSPIEFRASTLPNTLETEPNNTWHEQPAVALPMAFNGIISEDKDADYQKFSAKKGQVWDVHCYSRRIKSGLDPVINIFNAKTKAHIGGDDDARRPDCYYRFTVPEDGEYYVRIRDHLNRGRADFVYRVEFTQPVASLGFGIPRVDRYSQQRQQISVPQGNRFATLVSATRANFGGPLELLGENLPPGITMHAKPMVPNLNLVPVVFEAAPDAAIGGSLVDFQGRHSDVNKKITGRFSNLADFALGQPNNARYYGCTVQRLPMAVTKKLPFKIDIVQPKVPLVRDGSINLKIVATRDPGFDGQITMQFPFRSPGVGTRYQVAIPKGKNEALYPLNANANAQLGKWPIYCIGWGNVGGAAWASTQLAELEVAEPFVRFEMKRASCEQGSPASLFCKINHVRPFEGEAKVELVGVPANVTVQPLTLTKDTPELIFQLQTNEKSPIGKHSVFCRVTIIQNGEPVVSVAGRTQFQITKPRPKKPVVAAKPAAPKPAAKAAPKPKSRLQQLREAAGQNGN